jgi:uncharacterized SAM-binding protein YcdF (DUF218 family)
MPDLPSWLYDRLTLNDPPNPADLIFVFAGKMERKQYGLELYRAAVAPRLLLSIGRFEVSKMRMLGIECVEELISQRDRLPPEERHFFYEMNAVSGVRIERPKLRRWNTYGEVLALREYLERDPPRSLMIVSTDLHLRRIAVTFARVFRDAPLEVHYCPVPPCASSVRKDKWWARPEDRKYVLKETLKLAAYRAILRMPDGMIRRLMRLKD